MKSVRLSWSRADVNAEGRDFQELSFQLLGRLAEARGRMCKVDQYLDSVVKWTRRPYLQPGRGCLGKVDASAEEVYVGSEVDSVAVLPDPNEVVAGLRSGEVVTVGVKFVEVEKWFPGHTEWVTSIAVSRDGRWMVSRGFLGVFRVFRGF